MPTYKITRFYMDLDRPSKVILTGLTLNEARDHCRREDTHSDEWFDGYEQESFDEETCDYCDEPTDNGAGHYAEELGFDHPQAEDRICTNCFAKIQEEKR